MATFQANLDQSRFFAPIKTEDGEKRIPITYLKAMVIITTKWGDKVVFTKSNRGKSWRDSRTPKKTLSEYELKDELTRLLDCKEDAEKAFNCLNV